MLFKNAELHNIREMIPLSDQAGWQLSRVPATIRRQLNSGAQGVALATCGCEIRFVLEGPEAEIVLQRAAAEGCMANGIAEVYHGCFQGTWTATPWSIGQSPTTITVVPAADQASLRRITDESRLPFDPRVVRVILPYDWYTTLIDIQGEIRPPTPAETPALKLLSYGSSITHGGGSIRPTESYAMRTAMLMGYDLTNMGFAGSAQLEAAMADYIADELSWDIATLELGINVVGMWTTEVFTAKADYFITRIAQRHPDKWIFCTDLFTVDGSLRMDPQIAEYRESVRAIVARQNLPRLVYLPGNELLPSSAGLTSDLVHPSSLGMEQIANNLAARIRTVG